MPLQAVSGRSWRGDKKLLLMLPAHLWLATTEVIAGPAHKPVYQAKIPMDHAAIPLFPSVQLSAACGIVTVDGLGALDSDYVLRDDLDTSHGRPTWIGAVSHTQHLALSYHPVEAVWTIWAPGSIYAFVRAKSEMPPPQSSRWQIFNASSTSFEGVSGIVSISCPGKLLPCTALAVSTLPKAIAACNGPYRLQAGHGQAGVFIWSHVSDERCTMVHDKDGNAVVRMGASVDMAQASLAAAVHTAFDSAEWWESIMDEGHMLPSVGGGANVKCTSAGQTTSLVFYLEESRPVERTSPKEAESWNATSTASSSMGLQLSSRQDGSVISAACSRINVRIAPAEGLMHGERASNAVAGDRLDGVDGDVASKLRVKITVDGVVATSSLETASTQGFGLSLVSVEGTIVFEVCLLDAEEETSDSGGFIVRGSCIAETVLILEIVSTETQIIQRRSPSSTTPSGKTPHGVESYNGDTGHTRVVFLVGLESVDGYNLSTLNLMKHLPRNFRASALDVSCTSGDTPLNNMLDQEALEVFRLCIELPSETWDEAQRQSVTIGNLLYSMLVGAATWGGVTSAVPEIARALGDLYRHLAKFDALVISNGAKDADAYLLHVARLAGVGNRVVNLGALAGGYMSPFFSGATALIGPSQFVAHNPAVHRHTGGLPVKVCHPVMDAARLLDAAQACHTAGVQAPDVRGRARELREYVTMNEGATCTGCSSELPPARFIFVGRVSSEKTPGMFLRAMAVLRKRWMERPRRRRQPVGVVVGNGPLLNHMERLALDLDANVEFKGFLSVDAVPCEVQRMTALVLPSTCSETFGMVVPEAMLLGVPVVTFGFGGSGELVRHMENGMLVAEATPKALADALELLATDTALRYRLGAQARQDAVRALSLPEMVACHTDEFAPPTKR
ncbi:unnamed protein product [Ectocarpus fasciculatus]